MTNKSKKLLAILVAVVILFFGAGSAKAASDVLHVGRLYNQGVSFLSGAIVNPQGPVIIGDDLRVDGSLFNGFGPLRINDNLIAYGYSEFRKALVNDKGPVTIGDDLDVHGVIQRKWGPVKINDDLRVTGKLDFPSNSISDAMVVNDITASNYLPLAGGTLTGNLTVTDITATGVISEGRTLLRDKYADKSNPLPLPTVTSVSPTSTTEYYTPFTVTIRGTNFPIASSVKIGGTELLDVSVSSPTSLTATVPTGLTQGTLDVEVSDVNFNYGLGSKLFTVLSSCGETLFYSGQDYDTVQIGNQCWFAENLNVGTFIASTTDGSHSDCHNEDPPVIEKYCYDNDENYCDGTGGKDKLGGLYDWNEAMGYVITEGAQGICPTGWHIPTDVEWTTLKDYLGDSAGDKLKKAGLDPDICASSTPPCGTSGFGALLAGERLEDGRFAERGEGELFWSSSAIGDGAWRYALCSYGTDFSRGTEMPGGQTCGFSIRCLKD